MSAYEWSAGKLIGELLDSAMRTGGGNVAISARTSTDRQNTLYLAGVVLSKLNGAKRPFKEGDRVQSKTYDEMMCASYYGTQLRDRLGRRLPGEHTVHQVFFDGDWHISFEEKNDETCYADEDGRRTNRCYFLAEKFELSVIEKSAV